MKQELVKDQEIKKRKKRHQQLQRTFSSDDADFIAKNRVVRLIVLPELASFTALDPGINSAFTDAWLLNIETCEAHTTDSIVIHQVEEKTSELNKAVTDALKLVSELEYYVKKAFPSEPALWDEFGFAQRSRIQARTPGFILWLFTMQQIINDYEADLLAAGMPATFTTDYDIACGACAEAELKQEYAKRLRLRQTRLRVQQLNRLHTYLQRIQRAGAVIYHNNETKRKELE